MSDLKFMNAGDYMNQSDFRLWCNEKWYEHLNELEMWGEERNYTSSEYFNKYKYWLKREYKHQRG